ncbi:hypothetical protein [Caballeronia hypogeia]|nr:hypothetical protein [Caballeronia hypogeia]
MVILCSSCFLEGAKSRSAIAAHQELPELRRVAVTDWNEVMAESIRWDE